MITIKVACIDNTQKWVYLQFDSFLQFFPVSLPPSPHSKRQTRKRTHEQSAGKTSDKLLDAVTSGYFPALHHQGKVLDFIEGNPDGLDGCPFAGMCCVMIVFGVRPRRSSATYQKNKKTPFHEESIIWKVMGCQCVLPHSFLRVDCRGETHSTHLK